MQSLQECCAEAFHPPVAESFALASRSPMHIQKNQEKDQVFFSPLGIHSDNHDLPSSPLHLVLMLTKNALALVKIVSSANDPIIFIEAIFITLFQSQACSLQTVRNVP